MSQRGRPAKPVARHRADGTFQPCRHQVRSKGAIGGTPVFPQELAGDTDAAALWQTVLEQVPPPIVAGADTPTLLMLCRLWSEWRKIDRLLERLSPASKKYAPTLRNSLAMGKAWNSIACRFGLTPSDRARLHIEAAAEDDDAFAALLSSREASE